MAKKFPVELDAMFDVKTEAEARRMLASLRRKTLENIREYENLHRMLREHGYDMSDTPSTLGPQ